ncbi:hypothetical protein ROE7235_01581 [Roseibaca ekhonensis]|uniref:Uncharacterized protein n=1 Tax=Roseinatronobacter ekhonensis TaxID=254356 RepID=A0A3B0M8X2_9RHOB|nr:hypothetical protein ROE7235_01581 [Roseibaca ekhonensis]
MSMATHVTSMNKATSKPINPNTIATKRLTRGIGINKFYIYSESCRSRIC